MGSGKLSNRGHQKRKASSESDFPVGSDCRFGTSVRQHDAIRRGSISSRVGQTDVPKLSCDGYQTHWFRTLSYCPSHRHLSGIDLPIRAQLESCPPGGPERTATNAQQVAALRAPVSSRTQLLLGCDKSRVWSWLQYCHWRSVRFKR